MKFKNIFNISILTTVAVACTSGPKQNKSDVLENPAPIFKNNLNQASYSQSKKVSSAVPVTGIKQSRIPNVNKGEYNITINNNSHFCKESRDPNNKKTQTKCIERSNPHKMNYRYDDMIQSQGNRPLRPSTGGNPWSTSSEFLMRRIYSN